MDIIAIAIVTETVDRVTSMNSGVRPSDEMINHGKWFIYRGEDEHAEIIDNADLLTLAAEHETIVIPELQK